MKIRMWSRKAWAEKGSVKSAETVLVTLLGRLYGHWREKMLATPEFRNEIWITVLNRKTEISLGWDIPLWDRNREINRCTVSHTYSIVTYYLFLNQNSFKLPSSLKCSLIFRLLKRTSLRIWFRLQIVTSVGASYTISRNYSVNIHQRGACTSIFYRNICTTSKPTWV
jgi:hypothetical protein